jgi:hypothetical protein
MRTDDFISKDSRQCFNCLYWDGEQEDDDGSCHRFPPVIIGIPKTGETITNYSYFPKTLHWEFCGEFKNQIVKQK